MNLFELKKKLLAAARRNPPSDRVPYAFEKRIMAHLAAQPLLDAWAFWVRGFWRAVGPCVAVMMLLGAWTFFSPAEKPSSNNLSQDFENTLLAAVDIDMASPGE
jgi:peptidoglycan/LPS O-acetylase OafA/YrhL